MKKNIIYSILISMSTIMLTSCNDYLDKIPDNRTELKDASAVGELLVSAYSNASYMAFCEAMSDNADDKGSAGRYINENEDAYYWKEKYSEQFQDTPEYYWNSSYKAIAACNQALKSIVELGNKEEMMPYKGEALVARAYAHFMLVNIFSPTYDPSTANIDLGIPYVTEPEDVVSKEYKRASVAKVYELIQKDLEEGLPLIRDMAYDIPKYHFNVVAANAFATRFYLYTANWSKVIEHANNILPSDVSAIMRPWLNDYSFFTYSELESRYTHSEEGANLLLAGQLTWWGRNFAGARYSMSTSKQNEIFGSNVSGGSWSYRIFGNNLFLNVPKLKEHFKLTSINATSGRGYVMSPLFTIEEVLLNRAEAYAMSNMSSNSVADINMFLKNRIVGADPSADLVDLSIIESYYENRGDDIKPFYTLNEEQLDLVKCVTDLRRVEFVHEGMRWFDVRRFQIVVEHSVEGEESIVLKEKDLRRECQIPEVAIEFGLTANPREK